MRSVAGDEVCERQGLVSKKLKFNFFEVEPFPFPHAGLASHIAVYNIVYSSAGLKVCYDTISVRLGGTSRGAQVGWLNFERWIHFFVKKIKFNSFQSRPARRYSLLHTTSLLRHSPVELCIFCRYYDSFALSSMGARAVVQMPELRFEQVRGFIL